MIRLPMSSVGRGRAPRVLSVALAASLATAGGLVLVAGTGAGADGAWGAATEISAPAGTGTFNGLSCTTVYCTAVGYDGNGQPIYASEGGGTWSSANEITVSGGGQLNSVSCSGANDCTAVGLDNGDAEPIIATETGGTWGTPTVVSVPGDGIFTGVSCASATNCTAVGYNFYGDPIYATESGGTWGAATDISPPDDSGYAFFYSVSCTAAGDCTAVGYDGNSEPIYAVQTSGTWAAAAEVTASGGGRFFGVSCVAASDCTAVGETSAGVPVYATEADGTWGPVTDVSADGGGGVLTGVSCSDAADCTAVGQDADMQPVYVADSAGTWASAIEIPVSGGSGDLNTVSCVGSDACTAAGQDGNGQAVYTTDNTSGPVAPTVFISSPANNSTYMFGQAAPTSFSCAEGAGGPGLASCTDSNGATSGTGSLSTRVLGTFTYTVTAVSNDGLTGTASITYSVVPVVTLSKKTDVVGNYVEEVSGSAWQGDSSVSIYECASSTYSASTCGSTVSSSAVATTGKKAGQFKNVPFEVTAGTIDGNGDTCGLSSSPVCSIVVVGSPDNTSSAVLSFTLPKVTISPSAVIEKANKPGKAVGIATAGFPVGDTVTAVECDTAFTPGDTGDCDTATLVQGTVNGKGEVKGWSKLDTATTTTSPAYTDSGDSSTWCAPGDTCSVDVVDTDNTLFQADPNLTFPT